MWSRELQVCNVLVISSNHSLDAHMSTSSKSASKKLGNS